MPPHDPPTRRRGKCLEDCGARSPARAAASWAAVICPDATAACSAAVSALTRVGISPSPGGRTTRAVAGALSLKVADSASGGVAVERSRTCQEGSR